MSPVSPAKKLAERLNLIPVAIMAAGFLAPTLLFWGAAFGPLRPVGFSSVTTLTAVIGFSLCCVAAAMGFVVGDRYFAIHSVEENGRLYSRLGIRWVRRFITNGDLINKFVRHRYPDYRPLGGRNGLSTFSNGCQAAERGHLVLFLFGISTAAFALTIREWGWAFAITAGNIIANILPILLQRYNRGRLNRCKLSDR